MRVASYAGLSLVLLFFAFVLIPLFDVREMHFALSYFTDEVEVMGREGGIGPLIVSTLLVNGLAVVIVVILGTPVALSLVRLKEQGSKWAPPFQTSLHLLAGTPSIVFGLFGNVLFCRILGLGYSVLAGALTLCLMILPLFVSLLEYPLETATKEYKMSARSLGISESTFTFRILFPSMVTAFKASIVLAWARAAGETAALQLTSGYSTSWPNSLLDSGRALSVHVFDLAMNVTNADAMSRKAALTLLILTFGFAAICRSTMKAITRWN